MKLTAKRFRLFVLILLALLAAPAAGTPIYEPSEDPDVAPPMIYMIEVTILSFNTGTPVYTHFTLTGSLEAPPNQTSSTAHQGIPISLKIPSSSMQPQSSRTYSY